MPPSDSPLPSDGNQPSRSETAICGKKFRAMLACVEKTGAVNACNDKINEFLICERHVFHTATRKTPRQPSTPNNPALPSSKPPQPVEDTARSASQPFIGVYSLFKRAVEKQVKACEALVETIRRPDYSARVMQFGRRMMTEMRVTCDIVRSKSTQLWERFCKIASNGDDDEPRQR